jgi:MYXO-CTERM domain-containing protein
MLAAAVSGTAFICCAASAGSGIPTFFSMGIDVTNDGVGYIDYNPAEHGTWYLDEADGATVYDGQLFGNGNRWSLEWHCRARANPFVDAALVVTNQSDEFETFFISATVLVGAPVGPFTSLTGSVGATLTENDFFGEAELRSPTDDGGSIYRAYLDDPTFLNPPIRTLWDPGYSLVQSGIGTNTDSSILSPSTGPEALTTMGIVLRFDLSPGDSASITGVFLIEPTEVPAPGALALIAAAGLVGRRRRRAE